MFLKINFEETRLLYHEYLKCVKKEGGSPNKDLANEARRRLKQLEILMELIASMTVKEMNSRHINIPSDELWMYVECFYYLAFRTRNVIKNLPRLGSFDCSGIRNVRNQLLEHPEKNNSKMLTESFSWGKASGPVIKARRKEKEVRIFPDVGLYENYLEFQKNLNDLLRKVVVE